MKSINHRLSIRRKYSRIIISAAVLMIVTVFIGSYVYNSIISSLSNAVIRLSLPIASTLTNAELIDDSSYMLDLISELIPGGTVYKLSYINELSCETVNSVTTSGSTVISYNKNDSGIQNTASEITDTSLDSAKEALTSDSVITRNAVTGSLYTKTVLSDYAFTKGFYTVTSTTSLTSSILKPLEFLEKDMSLTSPADSPQILIFHTHSQEGFADSVDGDDSTTILGIGDYLTQILTEVYGYNVIHDRSVYDYVDGKLDRSRAYTYAEDGIDKILEEYPSIEVVIDLHRDGVSESTRLVTEIDGRQTAKVMFFNGISYSNAIGNIDYLANPYRDDNLAMSLQMHLLGEAYYPGFLRNIYINAYRYCLHKRAKSMLIEAGAQTNTFEEVKNAMEPLADILDKLLKGEKGYIQ